MIQDVLPPDDLQPAHFGAKDQQLKQELESAVRKLFYETCDGVVQSLLTNCVWSFAIAAPTLTLVVNCPEMDMNLRVLRHIATIGVYLERFTPNARVCVCPPEGEGDPITLRIDEISIYQDLL